MTTKTSGSQRVLSLDLMRGLIMILLAAEACGLYNALAEAFPTGLGHAIVAQFFHHEWHGLLAWDLVQPGFMLMAGSSLYISTTRKFERGISWSENLKSVASRSLKLFLFGAALHCVYAGRLVWELWNVLTQLSVATLIAYLIIRWTSIQQLLFSLGLLLLTELLYRTINIAGYDQPFLIGHNFGTYFDMLIMGKDNSGGWVAFNFVPTAAHTIWGVLAGKLLVNGEQSTIQIRKMLFAGIAGLLAGYLLDWTDITPIIKRISTSSFVLVSGGYIILFMALLRWMIDIRGYDRFAWIFVVIGMNPIFIYLFFETIGKQWFNATVGIFIGGGLEIAGTQPTLIAMAVSLTALILQWFLCYWLYQKKIFFKL
ncbi:DUF5009 domain-containing protein [Sphingobacterium phlebotomi]|uniref:DUF5009 domain-containing protein n=1 Tax=Sphingobacterium phlebotomi TaxID=2605433 RepID=A0A5D4GUS1_9SPHI|nr:DUF5009 domain-containing protein [Sphingobacterium phlebotomi]TYR31762.1 DUF5009 domain-containing protein [Sphingobacterium phlebotomi]